MIRRMWLIGMPAARWNACVMSRSSAGSTMDLTLPPDFKDFLSLLNSNGVEYLLIGGYAVAYHGYPRTTNDMDIWIAPRPDNAAKMVAALREFGFGVRELSDSLFLDERSIVRMGIPPMRIEVMTAISGVDFQTCFSKRVLDSIDGVRVSLIDLQNLKANKKASGRHKDLDDLEHLP